MDVFPEPPDGVSIEEPEEEPQPVWLNAPEDGVPQPVWPEQPGS